MPPDSPNPTNVAAPCFEEALEARESVVHDLEEGQIGLTEALARYEEGVKLLRQCYQMLESAERKIELLTRVGAAGEPIVQPFEDQNTSLEEKGRTRSRRRSRPADEGGSPPPEGGDDVDVRGGLF